MIELIVIYGMHTKLASDSNMGYNMIIILFDWGHGYPNQMQSLISLTKFLNPHKPTCHAGNDIIIVITL